MEKNLIIMRTDEKIRLMLEKIQSDIDFIKKHMIGKDEIMDDEEFKAYDRSFNKKNLKPLIVAEKELEL